MIDRALIERLAERCSGPISYGVDDCVPLIAGHLRERTGVDLMGEWRGKYSSREERDALLGHPRGLVRLVLRRMRDAKGWRAVRPVDARDPALGLGLTEGCWVVCLPLGGGHWATRSEHGLAIFGASEVRRAWEYGH